MYYAIDICHPNEFLANGWREVERFTDSASYQDHLDAPSFEMPLGTLVCVRNTIIETIDRHFISDGTRCIDVGPTSQMCEKYRWTFADAYHHIGRFAWPDRWRFSAHAGSMIAALGGILPPRKITALACLCVSGTVLAIEPMHVSPRNALKVIHAWAKGKATEQEAVDAAGEMTRLFEGSQNIDFVVREAARAVFDAFHEPCYAPISAGEVMGRMRGDLNLSQTIIDYQRHLSNLMRESVNFYDIAVGLVKPSTDLTETRFSQDR